MKVVHARPIELTYVLIVFKSTTDLIPGFPIDNYHWEIWQGDLFHSKSPSSEAFMSVTHAIHHAKKVFQCE